MKYKDYLVHSEFVHSGKICWELTGNGEYILGDKGAETFFIKRNLNIRYPTRDLPKDVYNQYMDIATRVENKQKKLRNLMKDLEWDKDHILVEERNFWDNENMFTTVTHYIEDVLDTNYDLSGLSLDCFIQLLLETSRLIKTLNNCKVIHGDIKDKNILIKKNGSKFIPFLLDFDSSYPIDDIPSFKEIGGTEGYYSPEILEYMYLENEELKNNITPKSDIFSLGVVFHRWWTNFYPGIDLEDGTVGTAVYLGKKIHIYDKFNVIIGPKKKATLKSLLNWMLAKDIKHRASIDDVIAVLEDNDYVASDFIIGDDYTPFDEDLWKPHKGFAKLSTIEELKKLNVDSFKRYNDGTGSSGLKYYVKTEIEEILQIKDVISRGYAKRNSLCIEDAWPEHRIEFESPEIILSKGYYEIKRVVLQGNHKYLITNLAGRKIDGGYEWLIKQGLAYLIKIEVEADTPWPEHGTNYIKENLNKLGIRSISRLEVGGEHRYKIVYGKKDRELVIQEGVSANNIKLMGLLK